jgi:hypothetical protein
MFDEPNQTGEKRVAAVNIKASRLFDPSAGTASLFDAGSDPLKICGGSIWICAMNWENGAEKWWCDVHRIRIGS